MYMRVVISVIDELYTFALGVILYPFRKVEALLEEEEETQTENVETKEDIQEIQSVPEVSAETAIPAPISEDISEEPATVTNFRRLDEIIERSEKAEAPAAEKNTLMYAGGTEIPLYMNPTKEFDSILETLSYGDMVMVLEQKGRWAKVVYGEKAGWVLREDLVDRAAHVYPKFIIGEENNAEDPNTIRIRAIIDDMFGGGKSEMPLQAGEYVMYRLFRKGLRINWPETRPRTPGTWHTILRGVGGIHIGVSPKTGSIMEYMAPEDVGHLVYVEAVFPDETINISETNYPEGGVYNERVLTREEWQKLRPVFIQVV